MGILGRQAAGFLELDLANKPCSCVCDAHDASMVNVHLPHDEIVHRGGDLQRESLA